MEDYLAAGAVFGIFVLGTSISFLGLEIRDYLNRQHNRGFRQEGDLHYHISNRGEIQYSREY